MSTSKSRLGLADGPHDFHPSDFEEPESPCWQCGGEGGGFVDEDWSGRIGWDTVGEYQTCPCCGGSGDAKDCRYW